MAYSKKKPADIRSLARAYTDEATRVLASIMRNSDKDAARVSAAVELLNRGWGRPSADVSTGTECTVVIRRLVNHGDGDNDDQPSMIDVTPHRTQVEG